MLGHISSSGATPVYSGGAAPHVDRGMKIFLLCKRSPIHVRDTLPAEYDIGSFNGDFILVKGIGDPVDISRSHPNAKKSPEQSI
jgi:hypothetical protein